MDEDSTVGLNSDSDNNGLSALRKYRKNVSLLYIAIGSDQAPPLPKPSYCNYPTQETQLLRGF